MDEIVRINAASDLYATLGANSSDDISVISKKFKRSALKVHPDKCSKLGAEAAFKKLSAAFAVLRDPDRRADYDDFGTVSQVDLEDEVPFYWDIDEIEQLVSALGDSASQESIKWMRQKAAVETRRRKRVGYVPPPHPMEKYIPKKASNAYRFARECLPMPLQLLIFYTLFVTSIYLTAIFVWANLKVVISVGLLLLFLLPAFEPLLR